MGVGPQEKQGRAVGERAEASQADATARQRCRASETRAMCFTTRVRGSTPNMFCHF